MKRRMPGAHLAVAHGKMGEEALSDVMQSMADGGDSGVGVYHHH